MPIPFIDIAIIHSLTGQRTDILSGPDGRFQVGLPSSAGPGPYTVEVVGYDCRSPVMDSNCDLTAYTPPTNIERLTLPQIGEVRFIFQSAVAHLPAPPGACPIPGPGQALFEDTHLCFLYPSTPGYDLDMGAIVTISAPQSAEVEPHPLLPSRSRPFAGGLCPRS
jgi:hypothetical protein